MAGWSGVLKGIAIGGLQQFKADIEENEKALSKIIDENIKTYRDEVKTRRSTRKQETKRIQEILGDFAARFGGDTRKGAAYIQKFGPAATKKLIETADSQFERFGTPYEKLLPFMPSPQDSDATSMSIEDWSNRLASPIDMPSFTEMTKLDSQRLPGAGSILFGDRLKQAFEDRAGIVEQKLQSADTDVTPLDTIEGTGTFVDRSVIPDFEKRRMMGMSTKERLQEKLYSNDPNEAAEAAQALANVAMKTGDLNQMKALFISPDTPPELKAQIGRNLQQLSELTRSKDTASSLARQDRKETMLLTAIGNAKKQFRNNLVTQSGEGLVAQYTFNFPGEQPITVSNLSSPENRKQVQDNLRKADILATEFGNNKIRELVSKGQISSDIANIMISSPPASLPSVVPTVTGEQEVVASETEEQKRIKEERDKRQRQLQKKKVGEAMVNARRRLEDGDEVIFTDSTTGRKFITVDYGGKPNRVFVDDLNKMADEHIASEEELFRKSQPVRNLLDLIQQNRTDEFNAALINFIDERTTDDAEKLIFYEFMKKYQGRGVDPKRKELLSLLRSRFGITGFGNYRAARS